MSKSINNNFILKIEMLKNDKKNRELRRSRNIYPNRINSPVDMFILLQVILKINNKR